MFGLLSSIRPSWLSANCALVLLGAQEVAPPSPQEMFPEATPSEACHECAALLAEREVELRDLKEELKAAHDRIKQLENELSAANEERLVREREWFQYTQAVALLTPEDLVMPESASFAVDEELKRQAMQKRAEEEAREAKIRERSARMLRKLRGLFLTEGVAGLDLLEAGVVSEGWTGPVVLRVLDEMRRPVGTMRAERMRLEGSLAGHTLTIVFEEGWEKHGGVRVPFELSSSDEVATRRFVLPHVDPAPWMREFPELFTLDSVEAVYESGWNTTQLRQDFNRLLREDASGGFYRLRSLGGVLKDELRDVHLESLDRDGHLNKRIFADRMRIVKLDRGVSLVLESGVLIFGTEKTPFLGGRHRIFLPRARKDAWIAAGMPGMGGSPAALAPEQSE